MHKATTAFICSAVIFFIPLISISAQDSTAEADPTSTGTSADEQTKADEKKAEEQLKSLDEDRRDTLLYGIDSEVTELIDKLTSEKDSKFTPEISEIYSAALNPSIISSCVNYFITVEFDGAGEKSRDIISNFEDENNNSLSAALRYVSTYPDEESEDIIINLVDNENKLLASAAITALGKCGTEKSADTLLDYLEDDDFPEELKPTIIKALGEMKSEISVDILIEILDDIDEEKSWRWNACEALGKIGDPEALPSIKEALLDKDTYLRSFAVKALSSYEGSDIEKTLIQSLRDSFWRVRVSAAEALGERKTKEAVDILIYKAEKDPEANVKKAAVKALGEIGTKESFEFLREAFGSSSTSAGIRALCAQTVIEKDLSASLDTVKKVFAEEYEKETSPILGHVCNFLSKQENSGLKDLYLRMLDHNDVAIKIYGIKGIELNGFKDLKEKLEAITESAGNNAVKKNALSVLEEW